MPLLIEPSRLIILQFIISTDLVDFLSIVCFGLHHSKNYIEVEIARNYKMEVK